MTPSPRLRIAVVAALALIAAAATRTAAARTVPSRVPKTVEVKMMNDGGMNRFEPKDVTIQAGDTVKWVAVSGNHNVSFWPDSMPAGAEALIRKALGADTVMAGGQGYATLTTNRKPTAGDSIKIAFTGMPKGAYKYNCRPHLMRGMVATVTVQ